MGQHKVVSKKAGFEAYIYLLTWPKRTFHCYSDYSIYFI